MSPMTTAAPSEAKRLAIDLPIPRPPPVMMAALSLNLIFRSPDGSLNRVFAGILLRQRCPLKLQWEQTSVSSLVNP
jgi:hypothetical protein